MKDRNVQLHRDNLIHEVFYSRAKPSLSHVQRKWQYSADVPGLSHDKLEELRLLRRTQKRKSVTTDGGLEGMDSAFIQVCISTLSAFSARTHTDMAKRMPCNHLQLQSVIHRL